MALKIIEGFDDYSTTEKILNRSGFLQWTNANFMTLSAGRFGGQSVSFSVYGGLVGSLAQNLSGGVLGFATKIVPNSYNQEFCVSLYDSGTAGFAGNAGDTPQTRVKFNGLTGSVSYPGGRTLNNIFPTNTWMYVEIAWTVSQTAGTIRIRINEKNIASISGINTQAGSPNSWINFIAFQNILAFTNFFLDDMYLCDNTVGPGLNPCNDFLGDNRVIPLLPISNVQTGWAASQGTNWSALNTGTSYNSTTTVGAEDTFNLADLPLNVTDVKGVQVNGTFQNSDATRHTLTQRLISGGVEVLGDNLLSPYNLSSSDVTYSDMFPVDPATGTQWLPSALRNGQIQAGYKLES